MHLLKQSSYSLEYSPPKKSKKPDKNPLVFWQYIRDTPRKTPEKNARFFVRFFWPATKIVADSRLINPANLPGKLDKFYPKNPRNFQAKSPENSTKKPGKKYSPCTCKQNPESIPKTKKVPLKPLTICA